PVRAMPPPPAFSAPPPVAAAAAEEKQSKRRKQKAGMRKWIKHMSLSDDGCRDRQGFRVRPVAGVEGCSYLVEGDGRGLLSRLSYVFGPIVENLRAVGYTDSNMIARPYDWRLPPHYLELRDKYFSGLAMDVERL